MSRLPVLLTVAGLAVPAGHAVAGEPGKLPPLVRVADADPKAPVVYDVPRADLTTLVKAGTVKPTGDAADGSADFRFSSREAAVRWFASARPLPPRPRAGGGEPMTALGLANFIYGPAVGPDGRAWFWGGYNRDLPQLKQQVEAACRAGGPVQLDGAGIVHVDRRGRVWLVQHGGRDARDALRGYDPRTRASVERRASAELNGFWTNDGMTTRCRIYESRSGRLYFPTRLGVHVLDGDAWGEQILFEEPRKGKPDWVIHPEFNALRFAEDPDGRVYVWAARDYQSSHVTVGYWTHDGKRWRNVADDPHVRQVVPRSGREVWIHTEGGRLILLADGKRIEGDQLREVICPHLHFGSAHFIFAAADGTAYFVLQNVRDARTDARLADRGLALPVRGPERDLGPAAAEFLASIRWPAVAVVDPRGWIWRNEAYGPGRGRRLRAMSPDGRRFREVRWTERLTGASVRGFDGEGNVYLAAGFLLWRADNDVNADRDGHGDALLPAMRVRVVGPGWPDMLGRMWCVWRTADAPVTVFGGESWKAFPQISTFDPSRKEAGGFNGVFPGAGGAMVVVTQDRRFHLIDAAGVASAASAEKLALAHPDRLGRALAYPPPPADTSAHHLFKDARGRVWWAYGRSAWGVVDGGRNVAGKTVPTVYGERPQNGWFLALQPLGDGRRVLAVDDLKRSAVLDLVDGQIVKVADVPIKVADRPAQNWLPRALRDSSGRVWVTTGSASYAVGGDGKVAASRHGMLTLEDRKKNLWFFSRREGEDWPSTYLVRRAPDGREVRLKFLDLMNGSWAEAPDGTVWVLTTTELLRVRDEGERLAVAERYFVPSSYGDSLWCDRAGRVWHLHYDGTVPHGWNLLRYATAPTSAAR